MYIAKELTMNGEQVGQGIYAGVPYIVVKKGGKKYIGLSAEHFAYFVRVGANMTLLDNIGEQVPDAVMAKFLNSIPKK